MALGLAVAGTGLTLGTAVPTPALADVSGTSVLIGAIAPIPIITPVRKTACDRLSDQLRSFLVGDDLASPAGVPAAGVGAAGGAGSR